MKNLIALVSIAAACSTSAFAQVSNFEGFSAATNLTYSNASVSNSSESLSDKSAGVNLQAAYGFALDANTVLTVGGSYALSDAKAGDYTNPAGTMKLKNQVSFYVEPGFLVNASTLVYGKLSYDTASLNAIDSEGTWKMNIKGMGYGIGARTMLDKNLFLQAEVKQTRFGAEAFPEDTDKIKTKNTVLSFGVGYKF